MEGTDPMGGLPLQRTITPSPASEVARRLVERARRLQREGTPPFKVVRSGLPSLDAAVHSWWGLTILAGDAKSGRTALAARLALETARAGGRVLWLEAGIGVDTPVFRLLTGISRLKARSVFVERTLTGDQWGSLEAAAAEVSALPLLVAEAHGATVEELRSAVAAALRDGPLELVVIDSLGEPERAVLSALERTADELDVPVLAVVTLDVHAEWRSEREVMRGPLLQRPGSLRLRLTRQETDEWWEPPPPAHPLWLDVYRAGEGFRRSIPLGLDPGCRWLKEAEDPPDG